MSKLGPTHYRIRNWLDEDGVHIGVTEFEVIKETPKGYWVESKGSPFWMKLEQKKKCKHVRFVSKNSGRRYCYPTLAEALHSFEIRKYRQVQHLTLLLEQAQRALNTLESYKDKDVQSFRLGINLGHTPASDQIVWDY